MRFLGIIIMLFFYSGLVAQTQQSWRNGFQGFWGDSTNWECNCVPTASEGVVLGGANSKIIIPAGYTAAAAFVFTIADSFIIEPGGKFEVNGTGANVGISIGRNATVYNRGEIELIDCEEGIFFESTSSPHYMFNEGLVTIKKVTSTTTTHSGIYMINGTMINMPGGDIELDIPNGIVSNLSSGIWFRNGQSSGIEFHNRGQITINGNYDRAIYMESGIFYNDNLLTINQPRSGIWLDTIQNGNPMNETKFVNQSSGILQITQSKSYGLLVYEGNMVINENGGEFKIINSITDPVFIKGEADFNFEICFE